MNGNQFRPQGFSMLPPVVKNLLIINGLLFLATWVLGSSFNIDLTKHLALYYPASDSFSPYQFVTHMFMHGGLTHLIFNMFALWMFGHTLENVWGSKRFLIYYIVTGLGAAALHTLINWIDYSSISNAIDAYANNPGPDAFKALITENFKGQYNPQGISDFISQFKSNPTSAAMIQRSYEIADMFYQQSITIPTVGASGAVYGILMAFGILFPNMMVYIYFLIPVRVKYMVIFLIGFELYLGIAANPGDNVAHFAHLGGMVFGYLLLRLWQKRNNTFY